MSETTLVVRPEEPIEEQMALASMLGGVHPYPLVFATIGGSRAFGTARADSDYDVHGMHQVSTDTVLGFDSSQGESVVAKLYHPVDETPVELATHELKKFLRLLLGGNGNVLEDLYSPLVVLSSPVHEELKELGNGCFSLRLASHYKGMAHNQQRKLAGNETKKFLHMFRCLMMGTYLMQTGRFEMNVLNLAMHYKEVDVKILVEMKQEQGNGKPWSEQLVEHVMSHVHQWEEKLRAATEESELPARPSEETKRALEDVLRRERKRELL